VPRGVYRAISFGLQLGGVAGSYQATISAVAKTNGPNVPYCIPNELICAELGRILGLPVPPAGIIHSSGGLANYWFASLDFNLTGNSLPPVDAQACIQQLPDLSTGLLLFDILIANCDRHPANFSVDFSQAQPCMSVFDHGHALFGYSAQHGVARLRDLRDRLAVSGGSHIRGNRHCLLDNISTDIHMSKWLDRIRAIPTYFLEDLCQSASGLGINDAEAHEALDFLKHRRDTIKDIVHSHHHEFRGIRQWGLFS